MLPTEICTVVLLQFHPPVTSHLTHRICIVMMLHIFKSNIEPYESDIHIEIVLILESKVSYQFHRCLFCDGDLWGKCFVGHGVFNTRSGHWAKTLNGGDVSSFL